MSRDDHYENQLLAPQWAKKCSHCGKWMHSCRGQRYGSNACRQAAYRERLARYAAGQDLPRDRPPSRNAVAPLFVTRRARVKGGAA